VTDTRGSTQAPLRPPARTPARARTTPGLFYRQVLGELRKVVRPTRRELITYTSVVIVFVLIMLAYVSGLDYLFSKAVLEVFG
jgi:preprotein translocase subunit SecE